MLDKRTIAFYDLSSIVLVCLILAPSQYFTTQSSQIHNRSAGSCSFCKRRPTILRSCYCLLLAVGLMVLAETGPFCQLAPTLFVGARSELGWEIQSYNSQTGAPINKFGFVPGSPVNALAYSADGPLYAGRNGYNGRPAQVVRYDPISGVELGVIDLGDAVSPNDSVESVAVGSGGKLFVGHRLTGSDFRIEVFDAAHGQFLFSFGLENSTTRALMVGKDGYLYAVRNTVNVPAQIVKYSQAGIELNRYDLPHAAESAAIGANGEVYVGARISPNGAYQVDTFEKSTLQYLGSFGLDTSPTNAMAFVGPDNLYVGRNGDFIIPAKIKTYSPDGSQTAEFSLTKGTVESMTVSILVVPEPSFPLMVAITGILFLVLRFSKARRIQGL
jgi:hypothetical protein